MVKRKAASEADVSKIDENIEELEAINFPPRSPQPQTESQSQSPLFNQQSTSIARIFTLPESVLLDILETWLDLTDVARLDSAVCNFHDRGVLLSLLQQVSYRRKVELGGDPDFYRWLSRRQIGLEYVGIGNYLDDSMLTLFPLKWSAIKAVNIDSPCWNFIRILHRCCDLCGLTLLLKRPDNIIVANDISDAVVSYLRSISHESGCQLKRLWIPQWLCTEELLNLVMAFLPKLTSLSAYFDHCSEDIIVKVFDTSINLSYLCLSNLPQSFRLATSLKSNLNLTSLLIYEYEIDDAALIAIGGCFPNLLLLDVVVNCTDAGVLAIADHCRRLTDISLTGSHHELTINDQAMCKIFENCTDLEILNLVHMYSLTHQTLINVAQNCAKLFRLELDGLGCNYSEIEEFGVRFRSRQLGILIFNQSDVCDEVLRWILKSCPNILYLSFEICDEITDVGIYYVSKYCHNLKTISFVDLPGVHTRKYVDKICRNNPDMHVLNMFLPSIEEVEE